MVLLEVVVKALHLAFKEVEVSQGTNVGRKFGQCRMGS